MDLDLTSIRQLAATEGIDDATLTDALQEALLQAYFQTPGSAKHARVELDDRSGSFTVWVQDEIKQEPTEENPYPTIQLCEEYDDTTKEFGRQAVYTAR